MVEDTHRNILATMQNFLWGQTTPKPYDLRPCLCATLCPPRPVAVERGHRNINAHTFAATKRPQKDSQGLRERIVRVRGCKACH
jgi:hypothetical protein